MVRICVVSTFTDNDVLVPPRWRTEMLPLLYGEQSIMPDFPDPWETDSLFANAGCKACEPDMQHSFN